MGVAGSAAHMSDPTLSDVARNPASGQWEAVFTDGSRLEIPSECNGFRLDGVKERTESIGHFWWAVWWHEEWEQRRGVPFDLPCTRQTAEEAIYYALWSMNRATGPHLV